MMRFPATLLAAFLAAAIPAPAASAQGDGCVETNPCLWLVDVDAEGMQEVSQTNFTMGDWFYLSVCNYYDDVPHTVSLEGYDLSVEVPAGECMDGDGFEFDTAGTFALSDSPSGDSQDVLVVEEDVVDYEDEADQGRETKEDDESGGDRKGSPSLGMVALGIGLLAAAAFTARRRA